MGKQVKGWTPPDEDEVVQATEPVAKTGWTPPADDEVITDPVKKKESSDQGGLDFIEQQRQQFEPSSTQPTKPSEKSTPKSTDTNDWRGISEAAKTVSPLVGAVVDFGRKIASGFADELPQAVAQGLEVAKSSVNPATTKEFIEQVPVDFQRYVREKEGLKWYEPFDQSKYIDKYADSFMEETGRAEIAKNIERNNPEILARRKEVESYVQKQKAEGAEKMAGATQSYKDVKDLKSLASYIGTLGGNAAYQIPLSVLTKGGSSLLQESATIYDQQLENISKEKGISRQEVIAQGLDKPAEGQAYAVLAATLDKVSAGNILKAFKSGGGQMVKKWVSSAVPEAVTEPAQGVLEDVGAGGDLTEALTSGKRIDEALGGLVGGSMGVLGPTKTEAVDQVRNNMDKMDPQSIDAAAVNIEQALNEDVKSPEQNIPENIPTENKVQEVIDQNEGELQSEPNTGGLPEVDSDTEQTTGTKTDAVVKDGPISTEEQAETVQQKVVPEGDVGQPSVEQEYEVIPRDTKNLTKGENFDYLPNKFLSDDEKAIESDFAKDLDTNFEQRKEEYLKKFGAVLDADNAKTLSEKYNVNPQETASAVHNPGSSFLFKVFTDLLKEPAPTGKKNVVTFVVGGPGAGKTTLVNDLKKGDSQIIYDTIFGELQISKNQINRALNAKKDVDIKYVYRNPVEAFTSMIERSSGGRRVVLINVFTKGHIDSRNTISKIQDTYKGNDRVKIETIGTPDSDITSDSLSSQLNQMTDDLYRDGKITESQYNQLKGNSGTKPTNQNEPNSPTKPQGGKPSSPVEQPPAGSEPPTKPNDTQAGGKTATLAIAKRILNSDADESIKRGVKQKGAEYIPKKLDITDTDAKNLIELYGEDKSEALIRDTKNDLTGDTRTALAARLYENYKRKGDESTSPTEKQQYYDRAVDIALTSAEQLKEAGRQTNAAKIWKSITSSEDMTVMAIEKEVERQGGKMLETIYKQVKRSRQQIDAEIERVIAERVTQGVESQLKRAKLISSDQKKKITDAFDALKVKDVGGAANDITRVLGAAVWNGSIEAVKRAVLAGADLANAIQAGVDYIRTNHKGDWDEKEYRAAISPAVEQMIPKEKVDASKIDESKINTPKLSGKKKRDFINQVIDAHNANRLTDSKFDQLYAKQLGAKELSAEERQRVRELAKVISEVEKFEELVKNDFTKENIAKYKSLLDKAQKANSDLQAYAQKPSNAWDTLISIMQGNLLTSLSLITNIYSNTALQPLRFLSTGIGSIIDYSVSTLAKTGLLSEMYKNPSIDLLELQKGYFQGAWNGAIEGAKQIASGPRGDERNLREINTQFSPVRAVARWADGNRSLGQKINDYIEGTIGWPAEAMFRLLNAGDKPFRRAAETARAMEIAKQKKLKGQDAEKFLMFPDPDSSELIKQAGDDATFQQDNASAKFVQEMLSKLINAIGKTPVIGGPLKVLAKSQIPYVKTPWNIMVETMKYAAFPVTGIVGIHQMAKGNKRSGSVLVGQALVGAMIFAIAKELFSKDLLSWDEPYDQKAGKQRERRQIQYDNIPPNSLNVSAIQRGLLDGDWSIHDNDTWIDYNKLGVVGLLFDNYSNNYFANIREDQQMPDESEFYVDMLTTAPRVLSQSLDQSFLKGTNAFLTALQDGGGYETEQWLINTSGALAAIVYPNTLSTVSKSSDEFMRDTRDDAFAEKLKNTYKTKFFIGEQLPAKVNLWGEKITGNPEGRDKYAFYLFDPTKFKNVDTENFKYKLYQAWKESKFDDDYLPSIPKREISYRKVKIKLDAVQYEKLATTIGEARKNLASTYIASAGFDRKDKEKVIKKLKDLYEEGAERGKKKFLREMGWNIMTPKKLSQIGKKE